MTNLASRAARRLRAPCLMTLAVLLTATSGARADDGASTTETLTRDYLQRRLDRTSLPGDTRLDNRLNAAPANGETPVTLTPDGDQKANFETSLGQWATWLAARDQQIIEEAKALAPEALELKPPKPAKAGSELDVWTRGSLAPSSELGETYTSAVGADVRLDRRLVVGGVVQMDRAKENAPGAASADGGAYLAGPYVGLRLNDHLTAGLTTAWGQGHDVVAGAGDAYALDTDRRVTEAKLKGDWSMNEWRIAPVATFNLREEDARGETAGTTVSKRSVTVGPEISRPIPLQDGSRIEPFARLNSSVDLDAVPGAAGAAGTAGISGAANTGVGAGFTLSKPDEYTFRASTDFEGLGSDSDDVKARLQLSVPLK